MIHAVRTEVALAIEAMRDGRTEVDAGFGFAREAEKIRQSMELLAAAAQHISVANGEQALAGGRGPHDAGAIAPDPGV